MIKIKYENEHFEMHTKSTMSETIACFYAILEAVEQNSDLKFAFETAGMIRKGRDAKNNSDN